MAIPALFAVGFVMLVLEFGSNQTRNKALAEIHERLEFQAALRTGVLQDRTAKLRREALFLASMVPIAGMTPNANHGRPVKTASRVEESWKRNIEYVFLGFARTDQEISHLRFIGVADGGKELIRVDRSNGELIIVPPEKLQRMGDRDFFIGTAACKPGEVYYSDFNLTRSHGLIEVPHQPAMRSGAPVFGEDGILYGMILVNIDAGPMLNDFRKTLLPPFQAYLTNNHGDFLSHPQESLEFGFDQATPHRWQDEFEGPEPADSSMHWIRRSTAPVGSMLVVTHRIPLDTMGRQLVLSVTYPKSALDAKVAQSRNSTLAVAAGILGLGGLILFLYLRLQAGVRRRILAINGELEKQVRDRTAEIETFSTLQRNILSNAGYAIIATDTRGIITLFNPAAEAMLGYSSTEVVGKLTPVAFQVAKEVDALAANPSKESGGQIPAGLESILAVARGCAPEGREGIYVRKDGSHLPVLVTVTSLRNEEGEIFGYLGIALDLTERRKIEDALRSRTEEAVAANRSKAEFLANMSHEIRTPMSAVLGLAYLLENRSLEPDARELVRKIRRAGTSLQTLIDDVLDYSKIEAGHLELENAPFRMDDVLDNLATIMGANAGTKDIELVIGAPPAGTTHLVGDAHRLEQVLINLTGNAIKFTERGSVSVSMELVSLVNKQATLLFSVQDTGIGIPPNKQAGIFESFSQADTSTTRRFGGTGLGLAISRLLVEKMGGRIEVESSEGRGCVFRFTAKLRTTRPDTTGETPLAHLEVLVADDNDMSREAIAAVASSIGWQAVSVGSGTEAIQETLARVEGEHPFDVLLIDWKMPDLDGLATVVQLHERLENRTPPIVLLATAYSREDLRSHSDSKSVDGILSKPVTGSNLFNAVMEARQRRSGSVPREQPASKCRLSNIRVLVVDDNEAIRELMEAIFAEEGAKVNLAENGEIAVQWLEANPGAVDIILMDVQMPVMDGYAAARLIRSSPVLAHLPIVALSAGVFRSEQDAALQAGMDDFLPKPFQVKDLVNVILRLTGSAIPVDADAGDEKSSLGDVETAAEIDVSFGISQWRTRQAFFGRLSKFAVEYADFVQDLTAHAEKGDVRQVAFNLHQLKGIAGVLAMRSLAAEAARLGNIVHDGGDPLPTLPRLRESMDRVMASIITLVVPPVEVLEPVVSNVEGDLELKMEALREALDTDNRRHVGNAMAALSLALPPIRLVGIKQLVEDFDFRKAEVALGRLAKELGTPFSTPDGSE